MAIQHTQHDLDSLHVYINNKDYDITSWQQKHPGGRLILQQFHQKDATEVFYAFHSKESIEKLKLFSSTPHQTEVSDEVNNFRKLRTKLEEEGYYKTNPYWYLYKISTTYLFFLSAVVLLMNGYSWFLSAILLGIGYQQSGWLGHDLCHHQVFKNRKLNNFFAYLTGNTLAGFSVNWWKDRHNTHHAATNILDGDPDIDNLPLFSWSEKDLHRTADYPLAGMILPYQQYYFLIFTPFLKLIWCFQSIFWLRDDTTQNKSYLKSRFAELSTLSIHWICLLSVIFLYVPWKAWLLYILVSEAIGGAGIALVVFMNHYACEKYVKEDGKNNNFIRNQLETTKNITPGVLTDWICGGLNYQIEHHLMPTIPRHNLSKIRPVVMEYCEQNNVPYQSQDFLSCLSDIQSTLTRVANAYTKIKEGKKND